MTDLKSALEGMGLSVNEEMLGQFRHFASLLARWNRVYNLTAIHAEAEIFTHHLLDSAALAPVLSELCPQAKSVLDVGSGGGLPAIPLAILRPDLRVTSIDAVKKKTAFVTQAAIELGLKNVTALHGRVEKMPRDKGFSVIASRAFASLGDFTRLTEGLLAPGGCWLAMKGALPTDEMEALSQKVRVGRTVSLSVPGLEARRCVVQLFPG